MLCTIVFVVYACAVWWLILPMFAGPLMDELQKRKWMTNVKGLSGCHLIFAQHGYMDIHTLYWAQNWIVKMNVFHSGIVEMHNGMTYELWALMSWIYIILPNDTRGAIYFTAIYICENSWKIHHCCLRF